MIRAKNFESLLPQIKGAVNELFEVVIENQKNPNDIVLYLSNGHIDEKMPPNYSKYILGPGIKGINDENRIEFFVEYLRTEVERDHAEITDKEQADKIRRFTIYLELMIYTHLWENEMSLKDLRQLVNMLESNAYDWENKIPSRSKYDLIAKKIRKPFLEHKLKAGNIISETYNSQIRNAFAHGQIYLDDITNSLVFYNYAEKEDEYRHMSFDDWESRFLKTSLFFHEILLKKRDLLMEYGSKFPSLTVWIPANNNRNKYRRVVLEWFPPRKEYVYAQSK